METIKENIQETADKLKKYKGKTRGSVFRTDVEYIKLKEGEEGIKKLQERMEELGVSVDLNKIEPYEWVSEGISALTVVVAKDIFDWTEEDVFEMGKTTTKISFLVKMIVRYLFSIESLIADVNSHWLKHYDFGSLKAEFKKKENKIIIKEEGYDVHPLLCVYHAGYYVGLTELFLKNKKVSVKETLCIHKGSSYNEYVLSWD
jgi:hypothetical protein